MTDQRTACLKEARSTECVSRTRSSSDIDRVDCSICEHQSGVVVRLMLR